MNQALLPPKSLPGFENINRYWDKTQDCWAAKILPGEVYVTRNPDEVIVTTLGSCVSACVRDPVIGVGGMNHFMLPEVHDNGHNSWLGLATRYGSFAMEVLINEIIKQGGHRQHLEVKLTGGGKIIPHMSDVGYSNIMFAEKYLERESLQLLAEDVGGDYPRKVMYYPANGRLRVKKLACLKNDTIYLREQQYQENLAQMPDGNSVELFD